ncbi:MAG: hypothetical protein FWF59_14555 [Turicibacter sp.]|nr:hypothetical protein [Turicibacter sp.]
MATTKESIEQMLNRKKQKSQVGERLKRPDKRLGRGPQANRFPRRSGHSINKAD